MPGLDGLELCRRIRALADAPYRYLILLTGRDSKADVVEGMEAGAGLFDQVFPPARTASASTGGPAHYWIYRSA